MDEQNHQPSGLEKFYDMYSLKASQAPNSPAIHAKLGVVCLELGKREEALRCLKKAVKLDPSMIDAKEKLKSNFSAEELQDVIHLVSPRPFYKDLDWAIGYPLAREGKSLILAGALLFTILDLIPLVGLLIMILIVYPFLSAYMLSIISSAAEGERVSPGWPDVSDFVDDVIRPSFRFSMAVFASYAPAITLFFVGTFMLNSFAVSGFLFILLVFLGSLYLPISLMAVALFENGLSAFNYPLLIRSIFQMPGDYFITLVFLFVFMAVASVLSPAIIIAIPFLGIFIYWVLNIYFMTVQMNMLGNIYYVNQDRLNWF